ncbi:STAS domain-containing protein [Caldichromatium japonicum]|uniref:STAS domain-containing protein n=1 Tax=Caldichromatium japonicum TaxID=2699430 RepID=A0A6G7VAM8_9GAMM|nr:STAS domain-containing protein [Caldichromatium japonicum]QIK36960.1 STAS domain-containing protein [Caldichromatium japonicum]
MSRPARLLVIAADRWSIAGMLDFDGVALLAPEGRRLLRAAARQGVRRITIDLAAVEFANSAALALLLDWLALARHQGLELGYAQIPESLVHLASLSNLGGLLPLVDQGPSRPVAA